MRFIDVFAGCGGLSLGLLKAGWKGVAAVEKNPMAFETLRHNLIDGQRYQFDWPVWLPKKAMSCENLLDNHSEELRSLAGTIDVMVGGPPCQGFSLAGRRNPSDPRNKMAEQYLELVKIVRPKFILIENVSGFNSKFDETKRTVSDDDLYFKKSYAEFISEELTSIGYNVSRGKLNCADFGVPQNRHRYFIMCTKIRSEENLFESLKCFGAKFKALKNLSPAKFVSVHDAIGDLEVSGKTLIDSADSPVKGFKEILYQIPDIVSPYLKLIRDGHEGAPNSLRLPKHKTATVMQFIKIRQASEPGRSLSKESRDRLGLKKHAITVLSKNAPAPTITTLPDDIIHYSEPRILTARETARIQSFPDWFEFTGKYTTGGTARKLDCPRYTQIGNAVPPLLSEAIGLILREQMSADEVLSKASTS
jgi:DNA (cytosine-5)-methyltransferase 1